MLSRGQLHKVFKRPNMDTNSYCNFNISVHCTNVPFTCVKYTIRIKGPRLQQAADQGG